ncbi:Hypothetical predicted protein [Mytilus galloprovincialis]|uniref:Uncharacterized protein n=1 Tax=Mytilus galloprovincialis TaxID=29158 RepID=A0A8B6D2G2_MYTGA|nr:Hypothetical predicted protein [Mytilus galloprovincialis]
MNVHEPMHAVQFRTQAEQQIFRDAQASKQMVYEVYTNVVGTLEEFESRIADKTTSQLQRSMGIKPEFEVRTNNEIKRQLETQIFLLQHQLHTCDSSIRSEVKKDLQDRTIQWIGHREEARVPTNDADIFAGKLFEILSKGSTSHPAEFLQSPGSIPNIGTGHIQQVLNAQHKVKMFDEKFRESANKVAIIPEVRHCVDPYKGAKRLRKVNPDADLYLPKKKEDSIR